MKQGWACLFGGAMCGLLIVTHLAWPAGAPIARYDFLTVAAVAIQVAMLAFRLGTWDEDKVILVFHAVGTAMELYKTQMGSWLSPSRAGCVSAACRSSPASSMPASVPISPGCGACSISASPATRRPGPSRSCPSDLRQLLHPARDDGPAPRAVRRCRRLVRARRHLFPGLGGHRRRPLLLGLLLVTLFIWFAEKIGTATRGWIYPHQAAGWAAVSPAKFGSWFLLMIIPYTLVAGLSRPKAFTRSFTTADHEPSAAIDAAPARPTSPSGVVGSPPAGSLSTCAHLE